jgi:hypothetical protein
MQCLDNRTPWKATFIMKIQNRNKSLKTNPSRRLVSYLSAGVCVAGAEARAALQVTFSPSAAQITAGRGLDVNGGYLDQGGDGKSAFGYDSNSSIMFSNGDAGGDLAAGVVITFSPRNFEYSGYFVNGGVFKYGATAGSANYANISFNTTGTPTLGHAFEAVGQFNLNADGTGALLAVAWNDDDAPLSISAGKIAIDAAAVPEPSAALLALLALGSTACARRRRHAVPR